MEKREVQIDYFVCREGFPAGYGQLCREAVEAARRAYCPYSGFAVGAAVLLANGEVVTGSNQENAAYPSGMCAERTALYYAGARHPQERITALAIAACPGGQLQATPVTPCGACRQAMAEAVGRNGQDFDVVMAGSRECIVVKASALLPFAFRLPTPPCNNA